MKYGQLANICKGEWLTAFSDIEIGKLVTDSRKSGHYDENALFIALSGANHDGHNFISEAYARGIRYFLVEKNVDKPGRDANMCMVPNTLVALQQIAAAHRLEHHELEVVAITGSNAKTIVKEWLATTLAPYKRVVRSPGSFNSQIGVPLSLWQIQPIHEIGIFEAGISQAGEMEHLQKMIRPDIGIFTNIGKAHDAGFSSQQDKINEKLKLFNEVKCLIYCRDHEDVHRSVSVNSFTWGSHPDSDLRISRSEAHHGSRDLQLTHKDQKFSVKLPFDDTSSVENAMHVIACMLHLGFKRETISQAVLQLRPMPMRLESKRGVFNSTLIDDTYNNDLSGIKTAVDFMAQRASGQHKVVVLSDVLQYRSPAWVPEVVEILKGAGVDHLIGIGPIWNDQSDDIYPNVITFKETKDFISNFDLSLIGNSIVLVKGARPFRFERITSLLEAKVHGTALEVNLEAITNNLNLYRDMLAEGVCIMVMVKAFAYGTGSAEVARMLEYHRVDYLGVAYADEGIALRNEGINLPIMVMNPSPEAIDAMVRYQLEPEIYSEQLLDQVLQILGDRNLNIHLKFDTGMHRLGFEQVGQWAEKLRDSPNIRVVSVFSHLASAEDPAEDEFTNLQVTRFISMYGDLVKILGYQPRRHILNSSGIARFPDFQFEMVRLGIGLHGVGSLPGLQPASRLRTYISQVKMVSKGETVGYGRRGKSDHDREIATIAIGYADGFHRALGNGNGHVWVGGVLAPVVGNVCMDMTMIDVTGLNVNEGDEVEIFGLNIPITQLAGWQDTIPYEILTDVSQRVRRVFFN